NPPPPHPDQLWSSLLSGTTTSAAVSRVRSAARSSVPLVTASQCRSNAANSKLLLSKLLAFERLTVTSALSQAEVAAGPTESKERARSRERAERHRLFLRQQ